MTVTAVIDTNVVVSGLLTRDPQAPTARILDGLLDGRFPFLLSPALLVEYGSVLARPGIRRRHGLSMEEIDVVLSDIAFNAMVRDPNHTPDPDDLPDPDDAHLWALLATRDDTVLVTGDQALLATASEGRPVVSPAAFLAGLSEQP